MENMTSPVLEDSPPHTTPITLVNTTRQTGVNMGAGELTPSQAAEELGVSASTVRRWGIKGILVPSRVLPGSRHRRYSQESVDALKKKLEDGTFSEDAG